MLGSSWMRLRKGGLKAVDRSGAVNGETLDCGSRPVGALWAFGAHRRR